jgi:hypothetical protein
VTDPFDPVPTDGSRRSLELYAFGCLRCPTEWEEPFEVQATVQPGGHLLRVFYRDGFPIAPPRFGAACRSCGGPATVRMLSDAPGPPAAEIEAA